MAANASGIDIIQNTQAAPPSSPSSSSTPTGTSSCGTAAGTAGGFRKRRKSCPSPEQIFATAMSFTAFLSSRLDRADMQTIINLLTLLTANLVAVVAQQEICEGLAIITEDDFTP